MTDLVVMLTSGKGTWAEASRLVKQENWSHVYFVCTDFGKEKFTCDKPSSFIVIDSFSSPEDIKRSIVSQMKGKLGLDVGVNMTSGTGYEHMALLSALLELGVGVRLVYAGENSMREI